MSSTPVFDAVARRRDSTTRHGAATAATAVASTPAASSTASVRSADAAVGPVVLGAPTGLVVQPSGSSSMPTSPDVPADLVEVIDGIPASLRASLAREHVVRSEQLPLVEAVVDAVTRAVVDAVASEVDRIVTSGVVRG